MSEKDPSQPHELDRAVEQLYKQVDPGGTLPTPHFRVYAKQVHTDWKPHFTRLKVSIESHRMSDEPYGFTDLIVKKGNKRPGQNEAHFDLIKLETHRGEGIGLATYLWAIEQAWREGVQFSTQSTSLSSDAVRIWKHLHDLGVAEEVAPFTPMRVVDGIQKYTGYYAVPLPGQHAIPLDQRSRDF